MSKFVKNLLTNDLRARLEGVQDALLVSVAGLSANTNHRLRNELAKKGIRLMMVKNSLARRATEGTPLAAAFEQAEGSLAIAWGASDIVALAKEVTRLSEDKAFPQFEARGGVLDGARLKAETVKEVSKWPTREEQLSLLLGQILGPGARLVAQLSGPGGALASQIKSRAEEESPAAGEAAPAAG